MDIMLYSLRRRGVGNDVVRAIKSFFASGCLLREVNATAIALIPKVQNPKKLKDYRPISCCNTIYKCISKIIANRIKPVLPHRRCKQQTAFVEGRRIGDNILLAQELLRNYHRDQGRPRCALKVDLMKAYDTVRWDFVLAVLRTIGFPNKVVQWIMECVTTTRFSVMINGELNGFFPGGRGLRQGDPMSPYLFVLAMEAFSGLMNSMVSEGKLKFHWKCDKEKISHLCFADDLLIFCKGEIHSVSCVAQCLEVFRQLSGLSPNPDKSNVFMCGIAANVGEQILSLLGYNAGCLPVRYLGVPLISSRLKGSDCRALVDRIIARAKSWTCRALSYAGRLQLVKIILFAIQVYRSSIFILPKAVIKQIEQTLRAFLWKGSDLSTRGAKVAWEYVCLPKKEGGLGLRGLEEWNRAAMLKHLWHICTDKEQSVWSSWIRTHLIRAKNLWELKIPGECTWAWRKILKLRPLARANLKFRQWVFYFLIV